MHSAPLSPSVLRRAPKVVLHQHLDGSLRPATVLELAKTHGYERLPEHEVDALARWFARASDRGSLPLYFAGFEKTTAVLQSAEALERAIPPPSR